MLSRLLQSEGRWIHALLVISTVTVALILIGLVSNIVVFFSDVLLVVVMAWLFAFILSPLAGWIERHLPGLPRVVVVGVIYGLLFVALSAIVVVVAVTVADSIRAPLQSIADPAQFAVMVENLEARLRELGITIQLDPAKVQEDLRGLEGQLGPLVGSAAGIGLATLGVVGNLVMVVFLSVFILIDKDRILAFFLRLAPPRYADEVRLLQTSVSSSFGGFIRGQAIQGVALGAVAAIGSIVLGIPFWPATALIVAILQMIPFFGPFVSWAPPVIVAALTPGAPVLAILVVMVAGWFVVMNIIQPRVMSNAVGIHPVMVLVSVLIGLKLQGVVGAIFAIPVAAVISSFFFFYLERSPAGGPRDVASRAARRVEEREGRPVRVPTAPVVMPGGPGEVATAGAGAATGSGGRTSVTQSAARLIGRGAKPPAAGEPPA